MKKLLLFGCLFCVFVVSNISGQTSYASTLGRQVQSTQAVAKGYYTAQPYRTNTDDEFFDYEYLPLKPFTESCWSAFWSDFGKSMGDIFANTPSRIKSIFSDVERKKSPKQRAQENRTAEWGIGFVRRRAQQYLDYLDQLEPLPRGHRAKIAGLVGTRMPIILLLIIICFPILFVRQSKHRTIK